MARRALAFEVPSWELEGSKVAWRGAGAASSSSRFRRSCMSWSGSTTRFSSISRRWFRLWIWSLRSPWPFTVSSLDKMLTALGGSRNEAARARSSALDVVRSTSARRASRSASRAGSPGPTCTGVAAEPGSSGDDPGAAAPSKEEEEDDDVGSPAAAWYLSISRRKKSATYGDRTTSSTKLSTKTGSSSPPAPPPRSALERSREARRKPCL
mmetsp:Transcript_12512/g.36247  ORF Transcript_12512/g.36247 Transcript_12512/m.36247 type:complete len:211 (+) Transcript_12512:494-1126(+)